MESNNPEIGTNVKSELETVRTKLVVGLGNPGIKYAETRHNAGFLVVDALLNDNSGFEMESWQPSQGMLWKGKISGCELYVLKPMTFMNSSGTAVGETIGRLGLSPRELLVVCDDLDMELGRLRLRMKGSCGGHNGVRSIAEILGTEDFPRLRMGVGRPQSSEISIVDYVLGSWTSDEIYEVGKVVSQATEFVIKCVTDKVEGASWKLTETLSDNGNATFQGETEVEKV